jgi:thioredoxin-related protein
VSAFINEKLVPVKSNAGKSRLVLSYLPKGSQKFSVPQTVFTDASGKEIERIVGYLAPVQFKEKMQSILTGYVS